MLGAINIMINEKKKKRRKPNTGETGNSTEERDEGRTQVDVNASPEMTTDSCAAVLEKKKKRSLIGNKKGQKCVSKKKNKLLG